MYTVVQNGIFIFQKSLDGFCVIKRTTQSWKILGIWHGVGLSLGFCHANCSTSKAGCRRWRWLLMK